jgi:hypothetical protein
MKLSPAGETRHKQYRDTVLKFAKGRNSDFQETFLIALIAQDLQTYKQKPEPGLKESLKARVADLQTLAKAAKYGNNKQHAAKLAAEILGL